MTFESRPPVALVLYSKIYILLQLPLIVYIFKASEKLFSIILL